jgi:hypothetical protein
LKNEVLLVRPSLPGSDGILKLRNQVFSLSCGT